MNETTKLSTYKILLTVNSMQYVLSNIIKNFTDLLYNFDNCVESSTSSSIIMLFDTNEKMMEFVNKLSLILKQKHIASALIKISNVNYHLEIVKKYNVLKHLMINFITYLVLRH